eukprot:3895620-Amphidinium_carterae.3
MSRSKADPPVLSALGSHAVSSQALLHHACIAVVSFTSQLIHMLCQRFAACHTSEQSTCELLATPAV